MNYLTKRFATWGRTKALIPGAASGRAVPSLCSTEILNGSFTGKHPYPVYASATSSFATLASSQLQLLSSSSSSSSSSPSGSCYSLPVRSSLGVFAHATGLVRYFSIANAEVALSDQLRQSSAPTTATVFTDPESGEQFGMILDTRNQPKLKPSVVQRRLAKCKTYIGTEQTIRQSPWKLNRICQLAAGLTLEEALTQLQFCQLKNADLVAKVLKRTSNLADIRDGLQMSQLEVAQCFTTKSIMLRRMKLMGRGRHGVMHHKHSNIRVILREIDFPLKIYQQKSLNQKKKWLVLQQRAERDGKAAQIKRQELDRMKQQEEKLQEERADAAAK